jgi:hypothetical protein
MLARALALAALFSLNACNQKTEEKTSEEIRTVAVGTVESLDLAFEPAPNPLVTNKSILEVMQGNHPKQLKVIPLKKGAADLTLFDECGQARRKIAYRVITTDMHNNYLYVSYLLRNLPGITVEVVGEQIVVDGKPASDRDAERILSVQAAYSDRVLNLATKSENLCKTRICRVNDEPVWPTLAPEPEEWRAPASQPRE